VNIKRYGRAWDRHMAVRDAIGDHVSPIDKIKRPKGMEYRDFNRRIAILIKTQDVLIKELMSI
jgi:hypothetical protein